MIIKTDMTKNEWAGKFENSLDNWGLSHEDKYTGWYFRGVFSVKYTVGYRFFRRYYPACKSLGYVRTDKNGGTEIRYMNFLGLTDPVSLIILYLFSIVIAFLISDRFSLSGPDIFKYAALFTLLSSVISMIITGVADLFMEYRRYLNAFLAKTAKTDQK